MYQANESGKVIIDDRSVLLQLSPHSWGIGGIYMNDGKGPRREKGHEAHLFLALLNDFGIQGEPPWRGQIPADKWEA